MGGNQDIARPCGQGGQIAGMTAQGTAQPVRQGLGRKLCCHIRNAGLGMGINGSAFGLHHLQRARHDVLGYDIQQIGVIIAKQRPVLGVVIQDRRHAQGTEFHNLGRDFDHIIIARMAQAIGKIRIRHPRLGLCMRHASDQ